METNVEGIFIAGVIAAGNNANEIFIENGRFHGGLIAEEINKESTGKKELGPSKDSVLLCKLGLYRRLFLGKWARVI